MAKYYIFRARETGEEYRGVKDYEPGMLIGDLEAESDNEIDAWELAERYADEVGAMEEATFATDEAVADEKGEVRFYVMSEAEAWPWLKN